MESSLNLKDTELRLGLPGTQATADVVACTAAPRGNKRASPDTEDDDDVGPCDSHSAATPPNKAQVVGWPPIRSYRRNNSCCSEATDEKTGGGGGMYVKVSMDGVPFLRKIDIKGYDGYPHLLKALESMFKFKFIMEKCSEREAYKGSEFVPTYEDKDGDWMLLGDVPWEMFVCSCKKLRVVKESEAKGLVSNI